MTHVRARARARARANGGADGGSLAADVRSGESVLPVAPSSGRPVANGLEQRLAALAAVAGAWRDSHDLTRAVDGAAERWHDPDDEVRAQLERVVEPFVESDAVLAVLAREARDEFTGAPARTPDPPVTSRGRTDDHELADVVAPLRTALLAAGTVPGLAIERALWSLAIGSNLVVRASRDDHTFAPWLGLLARLAPELASRISIVEEVVWNDVDSCVVMGADETVAWVREQLGPDAPVQAFGSKRGVVVATTRGLAAEGGWDERLRDDRRRFGGRGCMSPHDELLVAIDENVWSRRVDTPWGARARADRMALATIGIAAAAPELPLSTHVADVAELADALEARRSTLQTVTVVCRDDELPELARIALEAGASRVCAPSQAHQPPFGWVHDGRGQVSDLLRR